MGNQVAAMLRRVPDALEASDMRIAREIERMDDKVDTQFEAIKLYLVQVTRAEMRDDESRRAVEILSFTTNLEHIGDIIDKNLMELVAKKCARAWRFGRGARPSCAGSTGCRRHHVAGAERLRQPRPPACAPAGRGKGVLSATQSARPRKAIMQRLRAGRTESIESSAVISISSAISSASTATWPRRPIRSSRRSANFAIPGCAERESEASSRS